MRILRRLWVFIPLLLCLPVGYIFAQDGSINTIKLVDIDANAFPDVSVSFQAVDATGIPVDIQSDDISLYEDGDESTNVFLRKGESVPTNVLFLIDLGGSFSNLSSNSWNAPDVLRNALNQFVKEQFNEGVDTVSLYTTREKGTGLLQLVLEESGSGFAFQNAVNTLDFEIVPNGESYFAMITAAGTLSNLPNADQANLALVYMGDMHNSGDGFGDKTLLSRELPNFIENQLLPNNIRFFALHTATNKTFAPHLQLLANSTGGRYVELSQQVGNDVRVNNLYDDLSRYSEAYEATFRTKSGAKEQRQVVVVPDGDPPNSAESERFYTIDIQPPEIELTIENDKVERNQRSDGSFDNNLSQLSVSVVDWPDGHERDIRLVQLFVDGKPEDEKNRPVNDRVDFPLDLKLYEQEGETNVSLRVVVEDELGIQAEATDNFIVVVNSVPIPVPTVTPSNTPRPTAVPPSPSEQCPPTCFGIDVTEILPIVISLIALGLVGIMFFRFRNQIGKAGGGAVRGATKLVETLLGGVNARREKVLAKIKIVTAREDLRGQEVSIYEHVTRFGRNPQRCDIQLFDENDKSSVSGQHCSLQYDPRRRAFFLTDDNSSVGTYINGNPIAPNEPVWLKVGDEIVLGELARRGAKLVLLSIANDLPPIQRDDTGELETMYEEEFSELFGKNETGKMYPPREASSAPSTIPLNPTGSRKGNTNEQSSRRKSSDDLRKTILETTANADEIYVPDTSLYPMDDESPDWMDGLE